MKLIWTDRRTYIATLSILGLAALGIFKGADVAMALASVAIGVAGTNAYEKRGKSAD